MPGTPQKFKTETGTVLMFYCCGDGVTKDKEKDLFKAYFAFVSSEITIKRMKDAIAEQTSMGIPAIFSFVTMPTIAMNAPEMSAKIAPALVAPFHRTPPRTGIKTPAVYMV